MSENHIYITQQGLEKIQQQVEHLVNIERKNIAQRIQEAKELGDLSENAEYSSAKEDQAFLEMKIVELENTIKNAEIIECNSGPKDMVRVGATVKFEDKNGLSREYTIVGSHEANPTQGNISNESPLGRAFLGKKRGEFVEFQAPQGLTKFKILSIK